MADLPVESGSVDSHIERQPFDWSKIWRSPAFLPGVALFVGFVLLYFRLFANLWSLWMADDGYYSHGLLVPPICGYIVWRNWDRFKNLPVKPATIAIVPLIAFSWIAIRAGSVGISLIMSFCLIASLLCAEAFVAGWRWMLALTPATLYVAFAMPFWNAVIDAYTNPLQKLSTKVAFQILRVSNHEPYMSPSDDTTILLNHFTLNIAIPCSGLKLLLALTAFVVFFLLVARLKWWGNVLMLVSILPMALFFNGLRIALIGIVGDAYGPGAGMSFHDWSGYIVLLVCFYVLFKFAQALGWQD